MNSLWDGIDRRKRRPGWLKNVDHVMWRSDLLTTRFTLAIAALVWATLLLWPGQLFTPARQTYHFMSEIASEEVWGALFALQGVVMIYSLIFNKINRYMWVLDGVLGCVLWTTATVACFASHWIIGVSYSPPAAMSAEVALALASWWHLVRYEQ